MSDVPAKHSNPATTKGAYALLFSGVQMNGLRLKNRIALAPMTRTGAGLGGHATEQMARYYATFARGGFGLIIVEGTYTDESYSQGYAGQPGIATEAQAESWREVVDAVHAEGTPIILQLMHAGAISQANDFRTETIGPSAVRPVGEMSARMGDAGRFPTPREMTLDDIEEAIAGFVASARRAKQVGFDGIEIHGANGYLPDQFMTDYTNQRNDDYGGPVANRVRFSVRVVATIRQAVGPDYTAGIRISQTKVNDFEHRWAGGEEDAAVIFPRLAEAGASFIHISSHHASVPAFGEGPTLSALAKKHAGLPVIANGNLEDPKVAEALLQAGDADLFTLAKGALANTDWPKRVAEGREIQPFDPAILKNLA